MPPEFLEALFTLYLIRLRFYAAVGDRLELPPLPGGMLHGMLGPALACEACSCGAITEAQQSGPLPPFNAHRIDCLFRQLYQPVVPQTLARPLGFGGGNKQTKAPNGSPGTTIEHGASNTVTKAPAPHLIRPPLGRRVFESGDRFPFEVILVGRAGTGPTTRAGDEHAPAPWKQVVRAVQRGLGELDSSGSGGLGRNRVPCPLVEVWDGEGNLVWMRGYGFVGEPAVEVPARLPMPEPRGWVQLRFLTPVALKDFSSVRDSQGHVQTLAGPDPLGVLSRALLRRVCQLSALYCLGEGDPIIQTGSVAALPTWTPDGLEKAYVSTPRRGRESLEAIHPVLFQRVDNHNIHAEIGELHLRNVPDDFVRLCLIAQAVGIGSKLTHGLGWFEVLA